jgi:hypothetical protein
MKIIGVLQLTATVVMLIGLLLRGLLKKGISEDIFLEMFLYCGWGAGLLVVAVFHFADCSAKDVPKGFWWLSGVIVLVGGILAGTLF